MVTFRTRSTRGAAGGAGSEAPDEGAPEGAAPDGQDASSTGSDDGDGGGYAEAEETTGEDEVLTSLGMDDSDRVADEPVPPKRQKTPGSGRRKGSPQKRSHKKAPVQRARAVADALFGDEPPTQKLDRKMAGVLLTIVEGMTVPQLGEHARFQPDERRLIEPSLANILERMTPDSAKMFSAFADPIMLGTGILIWATRVWGANQRAAMNARRPAPTLLRQEPAAAVVIPTSPPPPAGPMDGQPDDAIRDDWTGAAL